MTIAAALAIVFGASVPCDAPPGTVVARILMSGGDGNAISYTMSGGDRADFRIRGSVIVVGPNRINPGHCGTNQTLSITATQL